ncbi:hypothetical protein B0A77_09305 [Flavobacterium branchiophilum]|uniref:Uncharacterized protein n=1 Tax=Flavobacterium branchiophilum TaxID=55197 RepID=A0A2H3KAZ7_9FLAO|nr:hypothetical protein B0A77_09305 [Flavobacterium branchiophilum]
MQVKDVHVSLICLLFQTSKVFETFEVCICETACFAILLFGVSNCEANGFNSIRIKQNQFPYQLHYFLYKNIDAHATTILV